MAGFFQRIFGGGENKVARRVLSHPRDLKTGDIIKFKFLDQPEISGQQFEVSQVNTYIYGDMGYPELVLKDRTGNIAFMMVEEEDGEEYLAICRKLSKSEFTNIISSEDIERIKKKGTGTKIKITKKPETYEKWLTGAYTEIEDGVKGSFIKGDARYMSDAEIKKRDKFTSHTLESSDEEYALELEIYSSGEMELSTTVYHDIDAIDEMWPAEEVSK